MDKQECKLIQDAGCQRIRAVSLCCALIYLAIPNLLFLQGWFTPWVAAGVGGCLLLTLFMAGRELFRGWSCSRGISWGAAGALAAVSLVVVFLLTAYFLQYGIVGIFRPHGDYVSFRQALFCNMRDAAWPVILPDGREMSYYLANILPSAMLARLLPESWNQWAIVMWSVPGMFLSMLLLASSLPAGRYGRGLTLLFVTLFVICAYDPMQVKLLLDFAGRKVESVACYLGHPFVYDESTFDCLSKGHCYINSLIECLPPYNSGVPSMLAASMLIACSTRSHAVVVPLTMALLAACSPIGCMALTPLAAVIWVSLLRKQEGKVALRVADVLALIFGVMMLVVLAVYFLRAESMAKFLLTGQAWGWGRYGQYLLCQLVAWVVLVAPLLPFERKNPCFITCAVVLLLLPACWFGTLATSWRPFSINELMLKGIPAYSLFLCWYWYQHWHRIGSVKYVLAAICILVALYKVELSRRTIDCVAHPYLHVADEWNGHLCHEYPFLKQSVPPCREPMIPGVIQREAGASEKAFPGRLLPRAPGCDYTRLPDPDGNEVKF